MADDDRDMVLLSKYSDTGCPFPMEKVGAAGGRKGFAGQNLSGPIKVGPPLVKERTSRVPKCKTRKDVQKITTQIY